VIGNPLKNTTVTILVAGPKLVMFGPAAVRTWRTTLSHPHFSPRLAVRTRPGETTPGVMTAHPAEPQAQYDENGRVFIPLWVPDLRAFALSIRRTAVQ